MHPTQAHIHSDECPTMPRSFPMNSNGQITCTICRRQFTSYVSFAHHLTHHHPSTFIATKCFMDDCGDTYSFHASHTHVLRHAHNEIMNNPLACKKCPPGTTFLSPTEFVNHIRTKHNAQRLSPADFLYNLKEIEDQGRYQLRILGLVMFYWTMYLFQN